MNADKLRFISRVLRRVSKEKKLDQQVSLLTNLCYYLTFNNPGQAALGDIETAVLQISDNYKWSATQDVLAGVNNQIKILHVLTEAALTGGHTRVVENTIDNRVGYNEEHQVLVTDQGRRELPSYFLKLQANNALHLISEDSLNSKIAQFINIAKHFQVIILHHHMYDVFSVVAAGAFRSNKLIVAYNHADHLFWVGSRAIDVLLEMSSDGLSFSKRQRFAKRFALLPIPLKPKVKVATELKSKLGIKPGVKVILTVGDEYRFHSKVGDLCYKDIVNDVLRCRDDVHFVIVGQHSESFWGALWRHPAITFTGRLNYEFLSHYYSIAALYLDSFPLGGGTSSLDAIMYGVPAIKVRHSFFEFDSLKPFVSEKYDIVMNINRLLSCNAEDLINVDSHLPEIWNRNFDLAIHGLKDDSYDGVDTSCDGYFIGLSAYEANLPPNLISRYIKSLNLANRVFFCFYLALCDGNRLFRQLLARVL